MGRTLFFAAAVVALTIAGCSRESVEPEAPRPVAKDGTITFPRDSRQLDSLTTQAVVSRPAAPTRLNGRMAWNEDRTVRIYSPFPGRVVRILAQPGDPVKRGQILAVVASPEFGQTQSDARKAESEYTLARANMERTRELTENGVAARRELLTAETEFQRAEAEVERARARTRLYGNTGTVDQTYNITSPIEGVVVEKNINPGQEVRPDQGGAPALFMVTDPTYLWVQLDASEKDLALIRPGRPLAILTPAFPNAEFTATVATVSDFFDPNTRMLRVRANIRNADRQLKAEMFVTGEIASDGLPQIRVPPRSVYFQGGRNYVFIETGPGTYTRKDVTVGEQTGEYVTIPAGLTDGDRIVTEGTLMLQQILTPRRVQK
jgi:cobalt-zinc-cadmium efflux system membrane fusion protein